MHILDLLLVGGLVEGPEEGPVHVVFPLFPAVLSVEYGEDASGWGLDAADGGGGGLDQVDVPDAAHHALELFV